MVESSLGYFINPLVSVLFGVLLLKERLRPWQWGAVGLGVVAVVVLTLDYGRPPWISLCLAASFGTYGLVKKIAKVGAAESMTIETRCCSCPRSAICSIWSAGDGHFRGHGPGPRAPPGRGGRDHRRSAALLHLRRDPGAAHPMGLLQYIAPVLQFLVGVFVAHEVMPPSRWIGFAIVWIALSLFTWDSLRAAHQARRTAPEPVTV